MATETEQERAQLESSADLYSAISDSLQSRVQRDRDQALWYDLVKRGWRRRNKPFPGCSDADIKMADSMIERVKPSYYAAIRGGDSLYRFTGLNQDSIQAQDDAAFLLDDRLNYHSNFNKFTPTYIHGCLQSGVGMAKVIWNTGSGENDFSVVPPLYWVVPEDTDEVQDADWFVHIIQMSPDQFMRDERFKKECRTKEYTDNIKGGGRPNDQQLRQAKCRREGLTYSDDANKIVLWEVWERTDTGAWMYSTKAATLWSGQDDEDISDPMQRATVRDLMLSPYKHCLLPFVPMKFEQPEEGIYAPRGIPELLCSYQTSAVKALNEQQDRLTFTGRPCFSAEKEIPGASNITLTPGLVLPFPVTVLDMGNVPIDFAKQMELMQELADQRIQPSNAGIQEDGGGGKTAAEWNIRQQWAQQGSNIRVVLMRLALSELGFMAWENLRQYDRLCLDYIKDGELKTADPKVWDGDYRIEPGGAVDGSSKLQQQQQAQANIEVGAKFPFVAMPEVVGDFYGLQGPAYRKRYILDPGEQAALEGERQATELADMLTVGFPIKVKPSDDPVAHLGTMIQYAQACASGSKPAPSPEFAMLQLQHGEGHAEQLKGNKSPQAQQILQGAAQMVQYLCAIIQSGQQQPSNVLPMGSAAGTQQQSQGLPQQPPGNPSGSSPTDQIKAGASVANAIAAMMKAGAPVSLDDINGALIQMGLPPLDGSSPIVRDPGSMQKPMGQPVPMPAGRTA